MPAAQLYIAGAVATVKTGAAYFARNENKKAAKKQGAILTAAQNEAIKQQQEQQALAVEQQQPYSQFGKQNLASLQGYLTPEGQSAYLENSPIFQAALKQNQQQLEKQAAVRGRTGAGDVKQSYVNNYLATAMPYLQMQGQNLFNAVGVGQNASSNLSNLYARQGMTAEEQQQALGNIGAGQVGAIQRASNQFYSDAAAAAGEFGQSAGSMGGATGGSSGEAKSAPSTGTGGSIGAFGGYRPQDAQNPTSYYQGQGISSIYKG